MIGAVKREDLEEVRRLLAAGHSANSVDEETGNSALAIAAWNGSNHLVGLLLEAGADPNEQRLGDWPLILASSQGHTDVVTALINAGALIDVINGEGSTALMYAASGGHRSIVEKLLQANADAALQDREGDSAIICAARKGHRDIVELLMPHASVSDKDHLERIGFGSRPPRLDDAERQFFKAVKSGDLDGVKNYLLAGGRVEVPDRHGMTALRYAMVNSDFSMLDALVQAGADVNVADSEGGYPLFYAAQGGSEKLYQYLLPLTMGSLHEKAARLRDDIIETEQWRWDRADITDCLEKQKLSKKEVDKLFRDADTSFSPEKESQIIAFLDEQPELAFTTKPDGTTLLMRAASSMNLELVQHLIETHCLDPNATNVFGHCALRFARPQPDRPNPKKKQLIYSYLYKLTQPELRERVEKTIAREAAVWQAGQTV